MATAREMPTKLIVLLALMGVSVGTNFFTGRWLAAIIGGLLIAGVFSGSDTVRSAWLGFTSRSGRMGLRGSLVSMDEARWKRS